MVSGDSLYPFITSTYLDIPEIRLFWLSDSITCLHSQFAMTTKQLAIQLCSQFLKLPRPACHHLSDLPHTPSPLITFPTSAQSLAFKRHRPHFIGFGHPLYMTRSSPITSTFKSAPWETLHDTKPETAKRFLQYASTISFNPVLLPARSLASQEGQSEQSASSSWRWIYSGGSGCYIFPTQSPSVATSRDLQRC